MKPTTILSLLLLSLSMALAKEKKPNIILLFADDLGYGDVSSYGSKTANTPAIDALAKDGFRSTDFLVEKVSAVRRERV